MHGRVFRREPLGAPHDDAVGNDQPDKNGQLLGDAVGKRLNKLIGDDHERGDDGHLNEDADARRNVISDRADRHIGKCQHKNDRQRHHDRRFQLGGHCERGTNPEHLSPDGIVVKNRREQQALGFFRRQRRRRRCFYGAFFAFEITSATTPSLF